ncbi:MAG: UbiD family decarboxylase [Candidatus Methanospirareceae archaeon]
MDREEGLRGLIDKARSEGRLIEIEEEVSSRYEVASICAKLEHKGLPILFHYVDAHHKVIMNVVGTRERLAELLGVEEPSAVTPFLASLEEEKGGEVKIVEESPTKEVVKEANLKELPILRYFERDGGAYITAGVVVTELDGVRNASIHRMMVLDEKRLAIRIVPSRHLHRMYEEAISRGEELKVGIAIGVDPLVLLAAATRVPMGKEFEYAASLMGREVELFKLKNGIAVPHAEIVLEGVIGEEKVKEGPFVDITATYDIVRDEPVITLSRMYHRKEPIYHAILPSGAEHRLLMGVPYEPLIFKAVERVAKPKNVVLTEGGCCYLHAVVQIEKQREGEVGNVIIAAFNAHPSLKLVIVVDADINIFDARDVEYAIATRVRWDRDIVFIPHTIGSSLDPSSENGITTKVGIDATKDIKEREKYERCVKTG